MLKYLSFSDLVSYLHNSWLPSFVHVAVGQFTFVMYALCILYLTTFNYNQISQGRSFIWSHKLHLLFLICQYLCKYYITFT